MTEQPERPTPATPCLACGVAVAPGLKKCPKCDWPVSADTSRARFVSGQTGKLFGEESVRVVRDPESSH